MNRKKNIKIKCPVDQQIYSSKLCQYVPQSIKLTRALTSQITIKQKQTQNRKISSQKNYKFHMENIPHQFQEQSRQQLQAKTDKQIKDQSFLKNPSIASISPEGFKQKTLNPTRKNKHQLKQLISKQKIKNLCQKYINKISRNNIFSKPVFFRGFQQESSDTILRNHGYQINKSLETALAIISILQIIVTIFVYSLAVAFPEVWQNKFVTTLQIFSFVMYLVEISYNCLTQKSDAGKKLKTFQQILCHYWKNNMAIDILVLLILIIDCNYSNVQEMSIIRLFILVKLPQTFEKIEKIEAFLIKNYHDQQYWSLLKIFFFNFCFAHLLAIILTLIARINPQHNWYSSKDIYSASWIEKYIWGYYWGCNIMLTVGFGDISATTYQEAICLIVIQIFSVMCLAYNISAVGTLINNIRSQDIEKRKNHKIFKHLLSRYELPYQLEWKINNYIEESINIRKKFNIQEENVFLEKLPAQMKKEYLKESNRNIFRGILFFGGLIDKTLFSLAECVQMKISHPSNTLRGLDDEYNLLILREGEVGYTARRRNCKFNDHVIDKVKVSDKEKPFLLGLQFLRRKRPNYQIKSLEYSVVYFLLYQKLINCLKESELDFQHFCYLRDKNPSIDEFQVLACSFCSKRHTKFVCPKLHFIPINQMVLLKQLRKQKINKCKRINNVSLRLKADQRNSLVNYTDIKNIVIYDMAKPRLEKQKSKRSVGKATLANIINKNYLKSQCLDEQTSYRKAQEQFLKNTTEVIKREFHNYKWAENHQDNVWSLESDKLKNYTQYFPEGNPSCLQENFNFKQKLYELKSATKGIILTKKTISSSLKISRTALSLINIK